MTTTPFGRLWLCAGDGNAQSIATAVLDLSLKEENRRLLEAVATSDVLEALHPGTVQSITQCARVSVLERLATEKVWARGGVACVHGLAWSTRC